MGEGSNVSHLSATTTGFIIGFDIFSTSSVSTHRCTLLPCINLTHCCQEYKILPFFFHYRKLLSPFILSFPFLIKKIQKCVYLLKTKIQKVLIKSHVWNYFDCRELNFKGNSSFKNYTKINKMSTYLIYYTKNEKLLLKLTSPKYWFTHLFFITLFLFFKSTYSLSLKPQLHHCQNTIFLSSHPIISHNICS